MFRRIIHGIKSEIFSSYEQFKHLDSGNKGSVHLLDDQLSQNNQSKNPAKPEKPAGFWTRIKGTFYMFAGYLGNPPTGSLTFSRFNNHYGIYDYLTFGIPYFLEYLCRGNWISYKLSRHLFRAFFTVIPIFPVLAGTRLVFGLIATMFASPVVLGIHAVQHYQFMIETQKAEREGAEKRAKEDIASFNSQYVALRKLFKENIGKPVEEREENLLEKAELLLCGSADLKGYYPEFVTSTEYIQDIILGLKVRGVPDAAQQYEGLFFRSRTQIGKRLEKIDNHGKYSSEAFNKAFAPKTTMK